MRSILSASRPAAGLAAAVLLTAFVLPTASHALPAERDFDARTSLQRTAAAPNPAQSAALARLEAPSGTVQARFDADFGTVRSLSNPTGYLTATRGGDDAMAIALDFVRTHVTALGLQAADLDDFDVTDVVYTRVTGATHIYLGQRHDGLPVYNGQLHVNVNRDGRIISVNNLFAPRLNQIAGTRVPQIDAATAVAAAATHIELAPAGPVVVTAARGDGSFVLTAPGLSTRDVVAELMWLPIAHDAARLVWRFQLFLPHDQHWFDLTVDAVTGQVWTRFDWIDADSYRALEQPTESPNHSSNPPPNDGRTVIVDPQDLSRSPLGWHDDGTTSYTIMRGNNTHAFSDPDGNGQPPATESDCGVNLDCDFDFPINFGTDAPSTYEGASVANMFYWDNLVHDVQYGYGFDEVAGNFQNDNFGNGGIGGDAIRARTQVGGPPCPNNAFFGTAPDGSAGNQIMCLWTPSTPDRDFTFDVGVLVHEVGHGISNRLVGGPSNTSCLGNTQQPGEGLSDWWALAYTAEVGDAGTDVRGSGTYILGQPVGGPGVRPQPYSTDPNVNSYTFASISGSSVPHGVGSVWAQAAWEAYWALVDFHGFDPDLYDALGTAGNQRMMLYVNEGLKNTTCSPSFLDVRDGYIQAAVDNHGGEDVCRLWEAFAAFGLGEDATTPGPNSTGATNGFQVPAMCLTMELFSDGFESGDLSAWDATVP